MTGRPAALIAGWLAAAAVAAADAPLERPSELELGASHEVLTNDRGTWDSAFLLGSHRYRSDGVAYGGVRRTQRFDQWDSEAHVGVSQGLAATWTGLLEASTSPTGNVLPEASVLAQLHKQLGEGWGVLLGARRSRYQTTSTDVWSAGIERYFGNYRAAYTFYSGRPENAGSAPAHLLQLTYYYDDRSSVGVSFTFGKELESVGPPVGVIQSQVRAVAVSGRHWFAPDWALVYEALTHDQGSLYRRSGARIGIRHRF